MTEGKMISTVTPLLLHFCISQAVVMMMGSYCDSAEMTAITSVLVSPIAIFLYRREIRIHQDCERRKGNKKEFLFIAVLGIAVSQTLTLLLNLIGVTRYFSNDTQEALLGGKFVVQIVGSGIFAPIAEEVLFRGLIYQRMKRMAGIMWSILLSSVLFAVYHGNLIQMIYAFPMALVLCVVYEKCDTIKGPIVLHMAANLTAVVANYAAASAL